MEKIIMTTKERTERKCKDATVKSYVGTIRSFFIVAWSTEKLITLELKCLNVKRLHKSVIPKVNYLY